MACSGGAAHRSQPAELDQEGPATLRDQTGIDPCASPRSGCPCDNEGASVECGVVTERRGPYEICSMGTRLCAEGAWSACGVARPGEGIDAGSGDSSGMIR